MLTLPPVQAARTAPSRALIRSIAAGINHSTHPCCVKIILCTQINRFSRDVLNAMIMRAIVQQVLGLRQLASVCGVKKTKHTTETYLGLII